MTDNASSLAGKWALVTGSSSGIGQAIAIELAKSGANVVVHGNRNREGANLIAAEIQQLGRQAKTLFFDLSTSDACKSLVAEAWSLAPIDIWVNNAGVDVLTGAPSEWTFDEKLAALWQVDVRATVEVSRLVGQKMLARERGTIVNIGWDQVAEGMEGDSGEMFATTKGAVMAFTLSLAKSLAPSVRVNCIAPGWIKTEWGDEASEYWQQRAIEESLLERWGTPQDIAHATRFLVSDEAAFITGQILNVNGGRA